MFDKEFSDVWIRFVYLQLRRFTRRVMRTENRAKGREKG
jgi:hypothetical protein